MSTVVELMTVLCRAAQQVHDPPVGRGRHGGEIHRIHRGECGLLVQGGWRCVPGQALCRGPGGIRKAERDTFRHHFR